MPDAVTESLNPPTGDGEPVTRQFLTTMRLLGIGETDRAKHLSMCQAYMECSQHDHLDMGWDNVPRDPGVGYFHDRMTPRGLIAVNTAVPSARRKPDAAYSLSRQIVTRFSEVLVGEGRRPTLQVESDEDTQAFLAAIFAQANVWDTLTQARDMAGSCGAALIACGLKNGHPTTETLNPKDCWVPEWETSPHWRPRVVVEQVLVETEALDEEDGKLKAELVWRTRAWTPEEVMHWPDVSQKDAKQDDFEWPDPETIPHGAGMCPVVWYQNTRDAKCQDGKPDCHGVWEQLDKIDRLQSQACKASFANVDPTLMIKDEQRAIRRNMQVQKGKAIGVGPQGDAKYLEMQGTGVKTAMDMVAELCQQVLQTVECVVIRPETAKLYQSGEALQILWRSMESRAERLRATLGMVVLDIAKVWLSWAAKEGVTNIEDYAQGKEVKGILLPPRKVLVDQYTHEDGTTSDTPPGGEEMASTAAPTGHKEEWKDHTPGKGKHVVLAWPPFWSPTPQQVQMVAAAMMAATGGKAVISEETALQQMSQYLGVDPEDELRRMTREKAQNMQMALDMAGNQGYGDDDEDGDFDDEVDEKPKPPAPKPKPEPGVKA